MKVWFDIHTTERTKLKLIHGGVPDPFVCVSKNAETHVVCTDIREATLNKPGIAEVKRV